MLNDKDDHLKDSQSLCPLKMVTGFPCPSCGITKSIVCFYKGDISQSLHYHILGPLAVIGSSFIILLLSLEIWTKKEYFNGLIYNRKIAYGLAVFIGIYHIIRLYYFISGHSFDQILKESIWK